MCRRLISDSRLDPKNCDVLGVATYGMVCDNDNCQSDAAMDASYEISKVLFEDGRFDVNAKAEKGLLAPMVVIMKACLRKEDGEVREEEAKFVELAKMWLNDKRTNVNAVSEDGATLLHLACGEKVSGLIANEDYEDVCSTGNLELCQMILQNPVLDQINAQLKECGST